METQQIANMIERGRHLVPEHMWDAVTAYFLHRYQPGGFLTALLSNDLMNALGKADDINTAALQNWCLFLYNYAPIGAYGTPGHVSRWLAPKEEPVDAL